MASPDISRSDLQSSGAVGDTQNRIFTHLIPEFVSQLLNHLDKAHLEKNSDGASPSLGDANASDGIYGRVIGELKDEIRRQSVASRRKHNEQVPVNRLPPDLLGEILAYELPEDDPYEDGNKRHERLLTLSNTCMHWNAVTHSTPELWSLVKYTYSPDMLEHYLIKSGEFPLNIQCMCKPRIGLTPSENEEEESSLALFFKYILPHSTRWESAFFRDLPPEYSLLLETFSAPKLSWLSLNCSPQATSRHLDLFDGVAPRLRTLITFGVTTLGSSPILSGLSSMTIGDIYQMSEDTIANMMKGLQTCRNLIHLRFLGMGIEEGTFPATFSSYPIPLPSLRTLDLVLNPASFCKPLLDSIHTPVLSSLHFSDHWKIATNTVADPSNPLHTVLQYVPGEYDLNLILEGDRFTFIAYPLDAGKAPRVELELSCEETAQGLDCLIKLMDRDIIERPFSTEIRIRYNYLLGDNFLESLARIPHVESIAVECPNVGNPLMADLGRPPVPPSPNWAFPELRNLTFMHSIGSPHLLWYLGRRFGVSGTPEHTKTEVPPARLEMLGVTDPNLHSGRITEFTDLLGPGVLHWRKASEEPWNVEGERSQSTDEGDSDSISS